VKREKQQRDSKESDSVKSDKQSAWCNNSKISGRNKAGGFDFIKTSD
jgi:hypothetical protein